MGEFKNFATDLVLKIHSLVYVFTLAMLFVFAANTAERAYGLAPGSVPVLLLAGAVLWETGERLALTLRMRRMRKK